MSRKTVGIVTLEDYTNYGNRLQNYALTKLLEAEGLRVVNGIHILTRRNWLNISKSKWKRAIKRIVPFSYVRKQLNASSVPKTGLLGEREKRFLNFTAGYTTILPTIIARSPADAYRQLTRQGIEWFIVGSDQVWNPFFLRNGYRFLPFAPANKRLSFAASMGVEEIPDRCRREYIRGLKGMKYLSVREQRAVEIVRELTGRDADLTLDPTLLLEPEKWKEVVKKPGLELENHYICTYFLGDIPDIVKVFARKKGLRVYNLNCKDSPELFTLDPGEFLYMIQNAAYVLTDSFHAVVFSIKFHREFYVFERQQAGVKSMFSRIETITKRFGLENRIQSRDAVKEQPPVTHWAEIDAQLLAEKEKSIGRLMKEMEDN